MNRRGDRGRGHRTTLIPDDVLSPDGREETVLIAIASTVVLLSLSVVLEIRGEPISWRALLPAAVPVMGTTAISILLRRRFGPHDPLMLPLVLLFSGLGLVLILTVRPAYLPRQMLWLVIGLICLGAAASIRDLERLTRHHVFWAAGAVLLLVLTSLFAKGLGPSNDIRLSLDLGPINVQPSEMARILIVLFLAGYLSDHGGELQCRDRPWWFVGRRDGRVLTPVLFLWMIFFLLLAHQRDLGAALLFFGVLLAMLHVASGRGIFAVGGTVLLGGAAALCYLAVPHVRTRIDIWLNPWEHLSTSGYQIVQSLFSVAWGGAWGTGLGQGYAARVPAVHTDLIFSATAEQLGFVGATLLMLCYAMFSMRALRIGLLCRRPAGLFLATGLGVTFALQTFVIIGGAIKLTPLTGVTLPFMSYGGTSLVIHCILPGMLISLSRNAYHPPAAPSTAHHP